MSAEQQPPSKLLRVAISILLVGHLMAVVLPPLSFQTRGPLGPSPSVATAFEPLEGYSQFLYIDRGYAFFAPDPGPSHLVQAAVTQSNGERNEIMFPDLQQQWPRLLYHRHFMLTEFLDEIYEFPGPPPQLFEENREAAERWERARARYEHVRQSVVEHLKHEYPGSDVAIRRIEHLIPDVIEFQRQPIALDDPRLYQVIPDQLIELDEAGNLVEPMGDPESIPLPEAAAVEQPSGDDSSDSGDQTQEAENDSPAERQDDPTPTEAGAENQSREESTLGAPGGRSDDAEEGASS